MSGNIFQITRTHFARRVNYAWWDAKENADGGWRVHFHADFVPSTDWSATDDADLFQKVQAEMKVWVDAVEARHGKND